MFLLIDNFDSFTYNLVQLLEQQNVQPLVLRNNDARLLELASAPELEAVLISPGPGRPEKSGFCPSFLANLPDRVPVLGICLGHQVLAFHAGCPVIQAARIMHGKTSSISHCGSGLFAGLPQEFIATRYHSLLMDQEHLPGNKTLRVIAWSEAQEPMALSYTNRNWFGVQFHPESILCTQGPALMRNFLHLALSKVS